MTKKIAEVKCGNPPDDVRTVEQWMRWRQAETERMVREVHEQIRAYVELEVSGSKVH